MPDDDFTKTIPGAKNFTYKEFIKSQTALRNNVNNIPNADYIWRNIELLARNILQPVRHKFGRIRITSGYRSFLLNRLIGGSLNTNHLLGQSADIEPIDYPNLVDIFEFIYDNLEFRELILSYPPDGWIHVTYRLNGNTKIVKFVDKDHHYINVTMNEVRQLLLPQLGI